MANNVNQKHRIPGTIKIVGGPKVTDHRFLVVELWVACTNWEQGFESPVLDPVDSGYEVPKNAPLLDSYVKALCHTFGVDTLGKLAGERVYALYSFGYHNERIEGLESARTGRRFTNTKWVHETFGNAPSPLFVERSRLWNEQDQLERRQRELREKLMRLPAEFVDWSK